MDIEKYLSNYYKGSKHPSLEAIKYVASSLNNPQDNLKIIHIAGTNGKGSVAEMMNSVLVHAGYKVGKFIGPHLIKYNERISINNVNISDKEMEELIYEIENVSKKYYNDTNEKLTLFDMETVMAFLYFERNKCDFVILETGLGGIYDSTNICKPIISIVTSIGYDHMHILGNTLSEIATQKAGIIKENSETVFVMQGAEINNIIIDTCKLKNNKLNLINIDDAKNYSFDDRYQYFDYKEYEKICINLKGRKQVNNALECIKCVEILKGMGYDIKESSMRNGLENVIHRGRFEKLSDEPLIIYDGGHNKPAIENFINSIKMYYNDFHKRYIISILKRKDYETIISSLMQDENSTFIFTSGNDEKRYVSKEELMNIANKYKTTQKIYAMELEKAIEYIKLKEKEYEYRTVNFIVGSFYIYGDVRKSLAVD